MSRIECAVESIIERVRVTRVAAGLGLFVAFCPPALSADPPPLRIAGSAWVGDAPTKVADGLGCFNRPPLPADVSSFHVDHYASGHDAMQGLLTGMADFALVATTPLALYWMSGPRGAADDDVVILASVALSTRSHHVIARGDRGIRRPADLAGRRVGVMRDTSAHFAWSRFVQYERLGHDPPAEFDLPVDALADALLDGSVDAVVIWEPWSSDLMAAPGLQAVKFTTRKLHSVNWLLLTRRHRARMRGGAADRVVACYAEAIDYIHARPADARRLHAAATGRSEAELERLEPGYVWHLGLDWSVLVNVETQFEWLRSRPGLDGVMSPLPHVYIEAGPLLHVRPDALTLPDFLHMDPGAGMDAGS